MSGEALEALVAEIRNDLDITWADTALTAKLRRLTRSGIAYLDDKLGAPGDYQKDGYPRTLLFEFVRYARDNALDVFEENYRSMILAMQNQRKVALYAEETLSPQ